MTAEQPLSIYNHTKGCFVLNNLTPPIINAFHPDYVKTYMPEFLTGVQQDAQRIEAGKTLSKHVTEKRKTNPLHGFIHGVSKAAKPLKVDLTPREFHIYNRAGAPKKTQSQIMSEVVAKKRKANKNWGTALADSKNIPTNKPEEL